MKTSKDLYKATKEARENGWVKAAEKYALAAKAAFDSIEAGEKAEAFAKSAKDVEARDPNSLNVASYYSAAAQQESISLLASRASEKLVEEAIKLAEAEGKAVTDGTVVHLVQADQLLENPKE